MATFYALMADLVALIHGGLIVIVCWMVILTVCKKDVQSIRFPVTITIIWFGGMILSRAIFGGCVMTKLQNHFLGLAGQGGYSESFLKHYLGLRSGAVSALGLVFSVLISVIIFRYLIQRRETVRKETR